MESQQPTMAAYKRHRKLHREFKSLLKLLGLHHEQVRPARIVVLGVGATNALVPSVTSPK